MIDTGRRLFIAASLTVCASACLGDTLFSPIDVGQPPPGKALVVFYRTSKYLAGPLSYIVREGNVRLGRLSSGTYFIATVAPGLHTFTVHAERHNDMQMILEAGETYFARFDLETGFLLWQPNLIPTDQRQFDQSSAHLKLSKP